MINNAIHKWQLVKTETNSTKTAPEGFPTDMNIFGKKKKKSANMRISSSQTHDNMTSTFYRKDNYCKISLQQIQKRKKITFLMELMCCFSVSALFFNSSFMLSFSEQIPRISSWCLLFSSSNLSKKVRIDVKHLKSFRNLGALHLGRVNRVSTNVRKSNVRLLKTFCATLDTI